ncbi:MAG TPA: adenylate/guanylate cyclase domain-containing protein [bacterium]|nr:adenylate/guanylate cyclase domain-containing protein [bacterium]
MPTLSSGQRAGLPNSAFAYIDSQGQRRLPINDESHVRNALARFNQVAFEDDAARQRARKRLLHAAKKFGILPIGFITSQLHSARNEASPAPLPRGFVTLLMTDIENSTAILRRLGARYRNLLKNARGVLRTAVVRAGGREIDVRADEFFAVFKHAPGAIETAVAIQRAFRARSWPDGLKIRVRVGIHSGRPTLTEFGYIGLTVHTVARVCSTAQGGQIVISSDTKAAVGRHEPPGIRFRSLGWRRLAGLADPLALYQVEAEEPHASLAPPRTRAARDWGSSPVA